MVVPTSLLEPLSKAMLNVGKQIDGQLSMLAPGENSPQPQLNGLKTEHTFTMLNIDIFGDVLPKTEHSLSEGYGFLLREYRQAHKARSKSRRAERLETKFRKPIGLERELIVIGAPRPDPNGARGPSKKKSGRPNKPAWRAGPHTIFYTMFYILYIIIYIYIYKKILYVSYWMTFIWAKKKIPKGADPTFK